MIKTGEMRVIFVYSIWEVKKKKKKKGSIMVVLTASDIGPNFSLEILEYKRKHHLQWLCGFNEKVRWNVNLVWVPENYIWEDRQNSHRK